MFRYNFFVLISVTALFFLSCNKNGSDEDKYFMTAELDGTPVTFAVGALSGSVVTASSYTNHIVAKRTLTDGAIFFTMINNNRTPLVAGTYTGMNLLMLYVAYQTAGKEYTNVDFERFTLQIISVTPTAIAGNFNGVLKVPLDRNDSLKFTNGHFNVRVIK